MVRGNILKTKVIISFSVQNLVIAPHFPQVNVQMPRPDLQGLGDLPLPIPPGALFLFHPSLNSSHLGLSVAQMSRAPYYLRDFLLALFSPATPSSSLTNSYLSFRSLPPGCLPDPMMRFDLLLPCLKPPQIPPFHFTCTHKTLCFMTPFPARL